MAMDPNRIAAEAGRPIGALTRRDVARALLGAPAAEALRALPGLRRQLVAAGNPLSAAFWDSAESVLQQIGARAATVGDVHEWLEATGTEPAHMIGLLVWDEESERSQLQTEIHGLLVSFLEERLAAGEIDPDLLVAGDDDALQAHLELQERWLMSPLPDGRVPMHAVMDEIDDEFLAEWDAADAAALAELRRILGEVGERPLPADELTAVCEQAREMIRNRSAWGRQLAICGGIKGRKLPRDDVELWLQLATGVMSPMGEPSADEDIELLSVLSAINHADWLGAIGGLARGGPGTPASPADLVQLIVESEDLDGELDPDGQDAVEGIFLHVVDLWMVLGAVDRKERLTALGWWGLPEALQRAWAPSDEGDDSLG